MQTFDTQVLGPGTRLHFWFSILNAYTKVSLEAPNFYFTRFFGNPCERRTLARYGFLRGKNGVRTENMEGTKERLEHIWERLGTPNFSLAWVLEKKKRVRTENTENTEERLEHIWDRLGTLNLSLGWFPERKKMGFAQRTQRLSLIHIWRCRRSNLCRSRWSSYH